MEFCGRDTILLVAFRIMKLGREMHDHYKGDMGYFDSEIATAYLMLNGLTNTAGRSISSEIAVE